MRNGNVCSTCDYATYQNGELVCECENSDNYSDYVDYDYSCEEWEGKER